MGMFTSRLIESRKRNNLTTYQLAEKINRKQGSYFVYEKSEKPQIPSVEIAAELAKALNVSIDYLVGLTDDPRPVNQILAEMEKSKSGSEYVTRAEFEELKAKLNLVLSDKC